ncbi:MAG TPA: hypothetical protein VGN72_09685 [Tepidisphaeraceae bacterium]|jgi:hypothetical protein|nr:hypothetical protein [Tepidisphaeraceae bacterium]
MMKKSSQHRGESHVVEADDDASAIGHLQGTGAVADRWKAPPAERQGGGRDRSTAAEDDGSGGGSDEDELGVTTQFADGFCVCDEATASWVVRRIVEARAHAQRVEAWAHRELRRAERDERWLMGQFGPQLEAWLRDELRRRGGGGARSVALPAGTVGLRRRPPTLDVVDEPAARAWCERHLRDALRVTVEAEGVAAGELARWHRRFRDDARLTTRLMRQPFQRYVAETGDLPDGATLTVAEDRLYVK